MGFEIVCGFKGAYEEMFTKRYGGRGVRIDLNRMGVNTISRLGL
jgi:hypothetical protein